MSHSTEAQGQLQSVSNGCRSGKVARPIRPFHFCSGSENSEPRTIFPLCLREPNNKLVRDDYIDSSGQWSDDATPGKYMRGPHTLFEILALERIADPPPRIPLSGPILQIPPGRVTGVAPERPLRIDAAAAYEHINRRTLRWQEPGSLLILFRARQIYFLASFIRISRD